MHDAIWPITAAETLAWSFSSVLSVRLWVRSDGWVHCVPNDGDLLRTRQANDHVQPGEARQCSNDIRCCASGKILLVGRSNSQILKHKEDRLADHRGGDVYGESTGSICRGWSAENVNSAIFSRAVEYAMSCRHETLVPHSPSALDPCDPGLVDRTDGNAVGGNGGCATNGANDGHGRDGGRHVLMPGSETVSARLPEVLPARDHLHGQVRSRRCTAAIRTVSSRPSGQSSALHGSDAGADDRRAAGATSENLNSSCPLGLMNRSATAERSMRGFAP